MSVCFAVPGFFFFTVFCFILLLLIQLLYLKVEYVLVGEPTRSFESYLLFYLGFSASTYNFFNSWGFLFQRLQVGRRFLFELKRFKRKFAVYSNRRKRLIQYLYFPGGSYDKASVYNEVDLGSMPGWRRSPGGGKWQPTEGALAWKIPWTEGSGGLESMGVCRVEHD